MSPETPNYPPDMWKNKYVITAVAALVIFVTISLSGISLSSEVVVKALGAILAVLIVAWFVVKPWK